MRGHRLDPSGMLWKCAAHLTLAPWPSEAWPPDLEVKVLVLGLFLFSSIAYVSSHRFVTLCTNTYTIGVVISILMLRWGRAQEEQCFRSEDLPQDSLAVLLGPKVREAKTISQKAFSFKDSL